MEGIILNPNDFNYYSGLISKLECMPSSERYFQEVFDRSLYVLKLFGNTTRIFPAYQKNLLITNLEFDCTISLEYSKRFMDKQEKLNIGKMNKIMTAEENVTISEMIRRYSRNVVERKPLTLRFVDIGQQKEINKSYN